MYRSYTMRLKPTKRQQTMLTDLLEHLCVLYNSALAERKLSWDQEQKRVSCFDQYGGLARFRKKSPEVKVFPSAIQRDPIRRVDLALKSFFRRCKSGEKPGFPRFKPTTQYDSFTVVNLFNIEGDTVYIPKWGGFRFKTKAKINGKPKVLHIQRKGHHWIANVSCYLGEAPEKVAVTSTVGIDLGLTTLATLSDGTEIPNPRWEKQQDESITCANRDLARRAMGSKNRTKSRERLRRVYQRIAGLRQSYVTGVAKQLFGKYDLIAYEKLDIQGMKQKLNFGRSIMDAAWYGLIWRLQCEAEKAGKWLIPVNPRNTTKICSGCGELVPKTLKERQHNCPACGLSLGRDHNAALNILSLGVSDALKQNQMLEIVSV